MTRAISSDGIDGRFQHRLPTPLIHQGTYIGTSYSELRPHAAWMPISLGDLLQTRLRRQTKRQDPAPQAANDVITKHTDDNNIVAASKQGA